eukprot:CAMPEP_0198223816 /NCGR_PEP_ID=MMETSP1445-20131203/94083_1 /TAXON_ID=36898 /ORGANISM="Pyramimonas sp., Strain CCMP2087" /LENGTH=62 /DNA_ID=CAMNT_0043902771 /DNA_START=109 /DNA_END=294 /DNA_ORIENTATION=+
MPPQKPFLRKDLAKDPRDRKEGFRGPKDKGWTGPNKEGPKRANNKGPKGANKETKGPKGPKG